MYSGNHHHTINIVSTSIIPPKLPFSPFYSLPDPIANNTQWMIKWKHQTWLFFSSIISIGGVPFFKMAAYGSSKAALTMFSAVLRQELSKWEVKVSNIQPGGFKTSKYLSLRALQCPPGRDAKGPLFYSNWMPQKSTKEGLGWMGLIKNRGASARFFFPIYGCSPTFFHEGVTFWCHVFFKHHLLPSDPLFFYPGRRWPSSSHSFLNFWTLSRCRPPLWFIA